MFPKAASQLLFLLLFFKFLARINCEKNAALSLSCLSKDRFLKYERFEVNFYFSSRNQKHVLLTPKNFNSGKIDFDPTRRTVVIAHGLFPSSYLDVMYNLRDAFIQWGNVNVIYVDWEKGCPNPTQYEQSSRNTEYAAINIAKLFKHFIKTWKNTSQSVEHWGPLHFIGLSLGAHVVGQAGALLKRKNQPLVDRITGLDPAEPCLDNADSPLRLKKSDARFVDIIHTDGARSLNSGLGLLEKIGHVDFYVNGGSFQPGCNLLRNKKDLNYVRLGIHLLLENGRCHHIRSIDLFTESLKQAVLKQCKFWARPWDSKKIDTNTPPRGVKKCDDKKCIEMGINAELYNLSTDVFYVVTSGAPPFCNI